MVLTFKLADDVVSTLRNVLLARGFVEFVEHHHAVNSWNLQWKTTRYSDADSVGPGGGGAEAASVQRRQRINHFQKTSGICKKDCLARSLRRMSKTWGSNLYGFAPETFILPRESDELAAAMTAATAASAASGGPPVLWICKPSSSSQGKNIFLISSMAELAYDCSFVVQRYIADPMLVGGYKYDLRIYVLVTSFRPLRVYMYREGLARFSSAKYDAKDTSNLYAHLTNASINKDSPELGADKDVIGSGCKWTIARWFAHLESLGANPYAIWERIKDIAILTLLPIVAEVPPNNRAFELFGFDVMLDSSLRPWIIEVNSSPAIAISGQQDTQVKIPLLNDLLDAVGFPEGACLAQKENRENFLPNTHPQFDPHAMHRADAATVAAAAVVANQIAAGSPGTTDASAPGSAASATASAASTLASSVSGRGDRVQRVPRLVKLQMLKGRDPLASTMPVAPATAAAGAPAAAAVPAFRTPRTRRPANDLANDSRIPRMPSQSPVRSAPSGMHSLLNGIAATPSRIPLRIQREAQADSSLTTAATATATAVAATAAPAPAPAVAVAASAGESVSLGRNKDVRAGTNQQSFSQSQSQSQAHRRRASSTGKMQPAPSSSTANASAAAAAAQRRSVTRRASVGVRTPTALSSAGVGGRGAKGKATGTSVPASASASAPGATSTHASAGLASVCSAAGPDLIGDFERIFPFDAATAAAADSISAGGAGTGAGRSAKSAAAGAAASGGATAPPPLPLLFGNFARVVVGAVKSRIRDRERLQAERRRARELDPSLPLRQPFVSSSAAPSPWTPEAVAAAVDKAKAAARAERARLGIPEPVHAAGRAGGGGLDADDLDDDPAMKDESRAVEAAIQQEQQQQQQQRSSTDSQATEAASHTAEADP